MSPIKTINVDYIARVEGQGAIDIRFDKTTREVKLKMFEPPRFFESFLIGRKYSEVHEITSRICGICPVAHQITALRAVENAIGLKISPQTEDLRKLMALSAYISSHALSLYFLTAPDFLGKESVIPLVAEAPQVVARAMKLKKLGNELGDIIGGRAIHPVYMVVNGFTNIPSRKQLDDIRTRLLEVKQDVRETAQLFAGLKYPQFNSPGEQIAISDSQQYAINKGMLKSTEGLSAEEKDYRKVINEKQTAYSYTKESTVKGRASFMVGPLPRVNINFEQLSANAKSVAKEIGFKPPRVTNPFDQVIARAIELVHSVDESISLIEKLPLRYEDLGHSFRPGEGFALTEAPRGLLYHSYQINKQGLVERADIVPPTAHNVHHIEKNLSDLVQTFGDLPADELTLKCEMLVRAYDPCISCSVH